MTKQHNPRVPVDFLPRGTRLVWYSPTGRRVVRVLDVEMGRHGPRGV